MNIKEIEDLLGKYYEGETSLAEEKLLKEFFSGGDVPEHLKQHQPMFRFFASEAAQTISHEQQEKVLMRRLDQFQTEASSTSLGPVQKRMYYLSGIAAGLLILLGLVFTFKSELLRKHFPGRERASVELAFEQTQQALLMVSSGLNTGFDQVQRISTLNMGLDQVQRISTLNTGLDQVQRIQALNNALEQVKKINKLYNYQSQFMNPERMVSPSTNN